MADQVTLLDCWFSVSAMRCRIALAEKEIQYETSEMDPFKTKDFFIRLLNPNFEEVPILIHNGNYICDSLIISQYIDETWKDKPPLMPSDPYPRAQARFWSSFVDKKISTFGIQLWTKKGKEQEAAKKGFIECLKELEGRLGDKSFFSGEAFGLLDLAIVPYYSWFHTYEKFGKFSIESECPKFIAWAKRCLERETVSRSLPDSAQVYDFVLIIRKKARTIENEGHVFE